jgi:hypothetical protein
MVARNSSSRLSATGVAIKTEYLLTFEGEACVGFFSKAFNFAQPFNTKHWQLIQVTRQIQPKRSMIFGLYRNCTRLPAG